MNKNSHFVCLLACFLMTSCIGAGNNSQVDSDTIVIGQVEEIAATYDTATAVTKEVVVEKVIVPQFTIVKRNDEYYNEYTPRPRYHVRIPKQYNETELDLIADSLVRKQLKEGGNNQLWVNYYLPNKKIDTSVSYGLSVRIPSDKSSTIFKREEPRKIGYNPPKARDLSNESIRTRQLWGAFDRGMIAGYEAGFKDGKQNRLYKSFDSTYPSSDEWIEQSYIQGYESGYLDGYDDAGGER